MSPSTLTELERDPGRLHELRQPPAEQDEAVRVFLAERPRLLYVAYRVVGDHATAEDVVQEAWVRWQRVDRRAIKNPAAFLTTASTNLAINLIQSARHRHEFPAELPRGVLAVSEDPAERVERAAAIERALALLLARLSTAQLTALLLRTCFGFSYQDVAAVLRTSPPNARQLVRRARLDLSSGRVRQVDADQHRRLVAAFTLATRTGELADLLRLLRAGAGEIGPRAPSLRDGGSRRAS